MVKKRNHQGQSTEDIPKVERPEYIIEPKNQCILIKKTVLHFKILIHEVCFSQQENFSHHIARQWNYNLFIDLVSQVMRRPLTP